MWAKDTPAQYWKAADLYERANGRLAELWMSPEMTRAFVVEEIEKGSRELRVALACVAARPTAFRGCRPLYVVFVEPSAAPREALS